MQLLGLLVVCLPAVSAQAFWWTNSGWSKPADFNSKACASNPNTHYFCGTLAGTKGENPYPNAFPIRRNTCTLADTLGRGCNWQGAVGSVICVSDWPFEEMKYFTDRSLVLNGSPVCTYRIDSAATGYRTSTELFRFLDGRRVY